MYACRVRGFVTLSGVTGTVAGHEDRLRGRIPPATRAPAPHRDALAAAGCDQVFIGQGARHATVARRARVGPGRRVAWWSAADW